MGTYKLGDHPNPLQARIRRKENINGKRGRPVLYKRPIFHALIIRRMGMMMNTAGSFI